jgi:hypothetical protein
MDFGVLFIVAGLHQVVRWQKEPTRLYNPSAPSVSYGMFLWSHEMCSSAH